MNIQVTEFKDLKSILELQKICYQENAERYNDNNIQPMTQTIEEIEKEFQEQVFLKIEDNSKIIGSVRAYASNNICYIGKLIVHPLYQNQGLGTKLMNNIENRFNQVKKYELYTGFKDEKNLFLYKKLGYNIFKEKIINANVEFVYMEKLNKQ